MQNIKLNKISTEDYPTPAKRPLYSVLDKEKVKGVMSLLIPNWETSLEVAITHFVKA